MTLSFPSRTVRVCFVPVAPLPHWGVGAARHGVVELCAVHDPRVFPLRLELGREVPCRLNRVEQLGRVPLESDGKGKITRFLVGGSSFCGWFGQTENYEPRLFSYLDQHVRIGEDNGRVGFPLGVV